MFNVLMFCFSQLKRYWVLYLIICYALCKLFEDNLNKAHLYHKKLSEPGTTQNDSVPSKLIHFKKYNFCGC